MLHLVISSFELKFGAENQAAMSSSKFVKQTDIVSPELNRTGIFEAAIGAIMEQLTTPRVNGADLPAMGNSKFYDVLQTMGYWSHNRKPSSADELAKVDFSDTDLRNVLSGDEYATWAAVRDSRMFMGQLPTVVWFLGREVQDVHQMQHQAVQEFLCAKKFFQEVQESDNSAKKVVRHLKKAMAPALVAQTFEESRYHSVVQMLCEFMVDSDAWKLVALSDALLHITEPKVRNACVLRRI
jgi:hypothetical protein